MELLALGIALFHVNNCYFRRKQMKLVSVQLGLAADSQLPNFYSFGYIGVCTFLQNLAETTHVQQATLAMKSVVIKR